MDEEIKALEAICEADTPLTANEDFKKLTRKMRQFGIEYVSSYRAKESAIRAGYSKKHAPEVAQKLLNYPIMKKYIEALELLAKESNKVSQEYFIDKCRDIIESDKAKNNEKINALTLLARITGFLKEKNYESKQIVVLQQQGLHDKNPTEIIIQNPTEIENLQ